MAVARPAGTGADQRCQEPPQGVARVGAAAAEAARRCGAARTTAGARKIRTLSSGSCRSLPRLCEILGGCETLGGGGALGAKPWARSFARARGRIDDIRTRSSRPQTGIACGHAGRSGREPGQDLSAPVTPHRPVPQTVRPAVLRGFRVRPMPGRMSGRTPRARRRALCVPAIARASPVRALPRRAAFFRSRSRRSMP